MRKDPEKLISLANELQEALERKQPQPARRADAKSFIEDGETSDNQHSGGSRARV